MALRATPNQQTEITKRLGGTWLDDVGFSSGRSGSKLLCIRHQASQLSSNWMSSSLLSLRCPSSGIFFIRSGSLSIIPVTSFVRLLTINPSSLSSPLWFCWISSLVSSVIQSIKSLLPCEPEKVKLSVPSLSPQPKAKVWTASKFVKLHLSWNEPWCLFLSLMTRMFLVLDEDNVVATLGIEGHPNRSRYSQHHCVWSHINNILKNLRHHALRIDIRIRVFQNAFRSKNLRGHLAKYVVIQN